MGKSHFGLYILALSLFGKEVGSMYIFLWMDCLQDWFDASMNILNGMKKKSFSFDLKQHLFSYIHNIYLHYTCTLIFWQEILIGDMKKQIIAFTKLQLLFPHFQNKTLKIF